MPPSTVGHLAALGIDADHVGELGLASASDSEILETARLRQSVVVTLDADFHQLLALSKATTPSTVRIRIEGMDELAVVLKYVIAAAEEELRTGAAVSVSPTRIRVRLLPIGI